MAANPISEPIAGFYGHLSIYDGSTWRKVGRIRDIQLSVESGEIDTTSHDTREWGTYIAGFKRWSLTASGLYIDDATDPASPTATPGDPDEWKTDPYIVSPYGQAQDYLYSLLENQSKDNEVKVHLAPTGLYTGDAYNLPSAEFPEDGQRFFEGTGTMIRWRLAAGNNDAVMTDIEIRGKSQLVRLTSSHSGESRA